MFFNYILRDNLEKSTVICETALIFIFLLQQKLYLAVFVVVIEIYLNL